MNDVTEYHVGYLWDILWISLWVSVRHKAQGPMYSWVRGPAWPRAEVTQGRDAARTVATVAKTQSHCPPSALRQLLHLLLWSHRNCWYSWCKYAPHCRERPGVRALGVKSLRLPLAPEKQDGQRMQGYVESLGSVYLFCPLSCWPDVLCYLFISIYLSIHHLISLSYLSFVIYLLSVF